RPCPYPSPVSFLLLLLLGSLRRLLEGRERLVPEPVEVGAERRDSPRVDAVQPPRPVLPLVHELRLLQHPQVLRDRRPADRELSSELPDGLLAALEELEDGPPGRIAQRVHRPCSGR